MKFYSSYDIELYKYKRSNHKAAREVLKFGLTYSKGDEKHKKLSS